MYIKENIIRLIYILLFITFVGCLFFSVQYLNAAAKIANNPSGDVVSSNSNNIDQATLDQIIKKVQ